MNSDSGTEDFLERPFRITSITRSDVGQLGAPWQVLALLTDEQMEKIAKDMEDRYVGMGSFWEDLLSAVTHRLKDLGLADAGVTLSLPLDKEE
jgi:hypothetical protein